MLTMADLLLGNWTWFGLAKELAPLGFAVAAAFFAGYQRGRRADAAQREGEDRPPHGDRMTERDYIDATNLAKLRLVEHALRDVHPTLNDDLFEAAWKDAVARIAGMRATLERAINKSMNAT